MLNNTMVAAKKPATLKFYTVRSNTADTKASAWTYGWIVAQYATAEEAIAAAGRGMEVVKSLYKLAPGRDLYVRDRYYCVVDRSRPDTWGIAKKAY